jgi:actin-related protein
MLSFACRHHTFTSKLRKYPEKCYVVLVEPPLNPRANREKMIKIMFETFNVPALTAYNSAVLAAFSSGQTSALVLESGAGATHSVPVFEGYALPHAARSLSLAGAELTAYMMRLLNLGGYSFNSPADIEQVCDIKEKLCYVALDFENEMKQAVTSSAESFRLADGQVITVGNKRFCCPEALFQPSHLGLDAAAGIHQMVYNSVRDCDADIHEELYNNIILSGGSTLFRGMADRLSKEIVSLAPRKYKAQVRVVEPKPDITAWIGGSILGSLKSFPSLLIWREDYDDNGPCIVHRVCF